MANDPNKNRTTRFLHWLHLVTFSWLVRAALFGLNVGVVALPRFDGHSFASLA
jgi:hypothetical protein